APEPEEANIEEEQPSDFPVGEVENRAEEDREEENRAVEDRGVETPEDQAEPADPIDSSVFAPPSPTPLIVREDLTEETRPEPKTPAAPAPPPVPQPAAVQRPPAQRKPKRPERRRSRAGLTVLRLIIGAMLAFVVFLGIQQFLDRRPSTPDLDVVRLAAEASEGLQVTFETSSRAEAAEFVTQHFNWFVSPPQIEGAELAGVSFVPLVSNLSVPAFVYQQPEAEPIAVFAWTYAFLDQNSRRGIYLPPSLYDDLRTPNAFTVDAAGHAETVVWRSRAAIFVAVPGSDAGDFVARLAL
ncbi:MAG: hypothetical protein AAGI08_18810, partial [Bacteroidota bacterium]